MSVVLLRHLDALEAQLRLGLAQIEAARHAIGAEKKPQRTLPERCAGIDPERCAEQGGEWKLRGTMADPNASACSACRFERSGLP